MSSAEIPVTPDRKWIVILMITVALDTLGLTILPPVAPFLVSHYVKDPSRMGTALAWLSAVYSILQLLAAPGLGALSDRLGRRPLLIVCLFGTAVGYLLLGIGGALWVLFLGRAIDGLTGANTTIIIAYIADKVPAAERTQFYGRIGALGAASVVLGPSLSGLLATIGYRTPLFVAGVVALANAVVGLFFLPESLHTLRKAKPVNSSVLNPVLNLKSVFSIPVLRLLLIPIFLYTMSSVGIPSNIGLFAKDLLRWKASSVGLLFSVFGIVTMAVQGLLLKQLLKKLSAGQVATVGLVLSVLSFVLVGSVAYFQSGVLLYGAIVLFAFGDGLTSPSLLTLTTENTHESSHGTVQGANQSVQSLAQIVGPLLVGYLYDRISRAAPYGADAGIALIASLITVVAVAQSRRQAPTD